MGKNEKRRKIKPLSNIDIMHFVNKWNIPNFRGVYMKDKLPAKSRKTECGIINLENSRNRGTHWTAYFKNDRLKYYFDSYGDAKPPIELVKYLGKNNLYYNNNRIQQYDDPPICGHLCLIVLKRLSNNENYLEILNTLSTEILYKRIKSTFKSFSTRYKE